jgi:hypothetical protein
MAIKLAGAFSLLFVSGKLLQGLIKFSLNKKARPNWTGSFYIFIYHSRQCADTATAMTEIRYRFCFMINQIYKMITKIQNLKAFL